MKMFAYGIACVCMILGLFVGCVSSETGVVQPREYKSLGNGIYQVYANRSRGFNYDYLIWVSAIHSRSSIQRLLVTTANTGESDDMSQLLTSATKQIRYSSDAHVANGLGVPHMLAVFPRPKNKEALYYTHILDRGTLFINTGRMKRMDRQLIAMIVDAKEFLQEQFEIQVKEKVFMHGFSANGTFALRFTTMYPDLVKAVAVGGVSAIPILPVATLDGHLLKYPVGIGDISKFTGTDFNRSEYNKVSKFVYMGDLDTNDVYLDHPGDTSSQKYYTTSLIWKAVGKDMKKRWEKSMEVLRENTENIQLVTYLDLAHKNNVQDMVNFLRANDAEGFHEIQPTGRWR